MKNLEEPVCITIELTRDKPTLSKSTSSCGSEEDWTSPDYWDDDDDDDDGGGGGGEMVCKYYDNETGCFEDSGCKVKKVSSDEVTCCCDHLTDYAVFFMHDDQGGAGSCSTFEYDWYV